MGRGCTLRRDVVGERSGDWFWTLFEAMSVADGDVAGDEVADMTVAIAQSSDKGPKSPLRYRCFSAIGSRSRKRQRVVTRVIRWAVFRSRAVVGTQRWVGWLREGEPTWEGRGGENDEVQTYSVGR
jgi:hypothetical protein